jgi:hypothetical protein
VNRVLDIAAVDVCMGDHFDEHLQVIAYHWQCHGKVIGLTLATLKTVKAPDVELLEYAKLNVEERTYKADDVVRVLRHHDGGLTPAKLFGHREQG